MLPAGLAASIDWSSWEQPAVFRLIADRGPVSAQEMERTFNLGVGMVAVVPASSVDSAVALLTERGVESWVAGEITAQPR